MRQLIIHFSDIHFNDKDNPVTKRIDNIVDAINSVFIDITEIVIVVSGDISFSGTVSQYDTAYQFFDTLKKKIIERFSINSIIYVAPGNHDRDFDFKKENEMIRKLTLEGIQKDEGSIDEGVINLMTEIQTTFFDFQKKISPEPANSIQNKIFNKYYLELSSGKSIIFNIYNSAWISILKENPGKLIFPINFLENELFEDKANLNISVIHHPFNWNSPQNSRELVSHLKKTSDFILTGHEHKFTHYLNNNFEGDYTEFIESGALQEEDAVDKSSFNIISIDLENESHLVSQFVFDGNIYRHINTEEDWNPIKRGKDLNERNFSLNENTIDFISRPGANFSNKIKGTLSLKDIYVFPDLKEINFSTSTSNTFDRYTNSKKILLFDNSEFKVVLTGAERSGKTSLCKMIIKVSYENKLTPIYLKGRDIKNTSPADIQKVVNKAFNNQYDGDLEIFLQSNNDEKIIVIDDFDKSRLKHSHRNNFLHNISNIYNKIIITGTDLIMLLDFINKKKDIAEELKNYNHFEIIQFGPKLRDKLIRKWLNINIEDSGIDLDEKAYQELDYISNAIKTVIGKNFIPSYPFFLLTILQAYESGRQHDLSASQYGSYYELLINLSLHKIDKKQEVITFYDNLLVEFCHFLYKENLLEISKNKFTQFHEQFKQDYDIANHLGSKTIIENLVKVGLLKLDYEQLSVFYDFIYYYYVAKFIRDTLHSREESKAEVIELVKNIHHERSANILMFLTHLSNEPFIYGLLEKKAKSIFSEFEISKLENDVKEINELVDEIPQLILEAKTIEEFRSDKLEAQNSVELEEKLNGHSIESNDEDINELELISKLNSAFKTIEIAGQISRKYYAKIKAEEKLELAKGIFSLGFRVIHLFISSIAYNKAAITKEIESLIEKDKSSDEIKKEINQFLFYISFVIGNGIIKKISSSIGSSELSMTFDRLEEQMPYNSTYLVNNSIKLEFNKGFSMGEVLTLKEKLKNNALPYMILKQQVIDYLYTFPVEQKIRDQICTHLDIPVKAQLIIDKTSRTKK